MPKEYESFAHKVQGKPSIRLNILGGLMLALSIAVAAMSMFAFPIMAAFWVVPAINAIM